MIYGVFKESFKNLKVDYYPFGLKHKGYNNQIIGRDHQYGYGYEGQKEEQNELGLNWIDYGARNYDASLGRWFAVDNMAEKFYDMTPYKYGMNNPILYTDPDGNCEWCPSWLFKLGVRVGAIDFNHPRNNPLSYRAQEPEKWARENRHSPTSGSPTKNITGNYFGDALYKLLGGNTFRKAFSGDHRSQGKLIMNGLLALHPGGRAKINSGSRLKKLLDGADNATDLFKVVGKQGDDIARYLDSQGAEAALMIEIDEATIISREGASVETIAEEIIHFNQFKKHGEKYFLNNRTQLEIEAQDQLLSIGKEEGWSKSVMGRIRRAKKTWQEQLEKETAKNGTGG